MAKQKLPLRTGVGIIVLNNQNKIFVGKRKDNPGDKWQMPQGGVDKGEDYITGQKQKWFITRFLGEEKEINLNTKHAEFIDWKWIEPKLLPKVIVNFKKDLYLNLLKEINLVIE